MEERDALRGLDKIQKDAIETAREIEIIENVRIQTVTTQVSFSSMMAGLERGDYVIPGFQRMYRWSEGQVEELAISLVRGMPIPPIYCYRNREQQIVILDGQQRVISLYLYYIGSFLKRKRNAFIDARKAASEDAGFREYLETCGLTEKKYSMSYKDDNGNDEIVDITYQNLSIRLKRRIDFAPITVVEINVDSEKYRERTLHKIFANLNIGGTPLSSQELRNGIYSCKFYDMLYEINETSKKWRQLYSGSANSEVNKEGKDVELLVRMCAFKYFVRKVGDNFILTNYRGKITTFLDEFSEQAVAFSQEQIDAYKKSLLTFIDHVEEVKGREKNLALISIYVVWDNMKRHLVITKEMYIQIISSKEYSETTKSGTSGKNEIEKRIGSVYEQLSKYDQ